MKIWSARLIVLQIGQGGGWSEGTGIVGVKKAKGERGCKGKKHGQQL